MIDDWRTRPLSSAEFNGSLDAFLEALYRRWRDRPATGMNFEDIEAVLLETFEPPQP